MDREAGAQEVEAAGGAVWRRSPSGSLEVLLVHRPSYDDWTMPKGKLDPGERPEDAARREVQEETGLACRLGAALGEIRYVDRHGRPKRVRYWAMQVIDGSFAPNDEVDELRWLALPAAATALTYARDRIVLDALAGAVTP